MLKLYDYFRSTASYRVRIALNLKGIDHECIPVHLVRDGGEQHLPAYRALNPQGLLPSVALEDKITLTQSLAIIDYLDETYPKPALLPQSPIARTEVKSLALLIACDIHPLNNLRVLNQLKSQFNASEEDITTWYHHWLKLGFDALEAKLALHHTKAPALFCYNHAVSLADICLIPQVYNAKRFNFSLAPYPLISAIDAHCLTLDAFKKAAPENSSTA